MTKKKIFSSVGCVSTCILMLYSSLSYSDELDRLAVTSNGQSQGQIYANGNMQLELDINWEWNSTIPEEDREITKITLIDYQSGMDIQDIGYRYIDSSGNPIGDRGFNKLITNSLKERSDPITTNVNEGHAVRYVDTSQVTNIEICIEVETKLGSVQDTCNSSLEDYAVYLESHVPVILPKEAWSIDVIADERYDAESKGTMRKLLDVSIDHPYFPGVHSKQYSDTWSDGQLPPDLGDGITHEFAHAGTSDTQKVTYTLNSDAVTVIVPSTAFDTGGRGKYSNETFNIPEAGSKVVQRLVLITHQAYNNTDRSTQFYGYKAGEWELKSFIEHQYDSNYTEVFNFSGEYEGHLQVNYSTWGTKTQATIGIIDMYGTEQSIIYESRLNTQEILL
ncbi:hypothetical protein L1D31_22220 [Vibrio sp. Isolate23]|uniref:hypothetical protein n=1 Tax=Vibrio sp. Isolate23 TaxID=2908533 RepID=UPI001EFEA0B3|nr:hypothetical protein [Vibrio sp. Isolate23]MCG9685236.1 hypothetical protein [Vibrio sp. Isolate23]